MKFTATRAGEIGPWVFFINGHVDDTGQAKYASSSPSQSRVRATSVRHSP